MPTYQYACTACAHRLEAVQSFTDDPLTQCPVCAGRLRKLFGSVGIVFKGPGFYRTDSRAAANGKAGGNGSAESGSGGAADGGKAGTKDAKDKTPVGATSPSSGSNGSGSGGSSTGTAGSGSAGSAGSGSSGGTNS